MFNELLYDIIHAKSINDILQIKAVIKKHFSYIYEHYPEPLCFRYTTKHLKWYCSHLDYINQKLDSEFFTKFSNTATKEQQLEIVDKIFK